jgi:AraC family transcriptional activator of pobA
MDEAAADLYFSVMKPRRAVPTTRSGAGARTAPVPAYFLYEEPLQAPDERLVHVETIAARSRLHDWVIRPHRHRDLHQLILLRSGRVQARLDGHGASLRPPAAIVVPPGTVHSFRFLPGSVGLVISFAGSLAQALSGTSTALFGRLERASATRLARAAVAETDLWMLGTMLLREFGRAAPGRHAALRGLLGALLSNLLRLLPDESSQANATNLTVSADRELVAQFRHEIERRFRTHAGIARYAAALGVAETRLRRACVAATGQSPVQLVHLRLLLEAERQLRYTSMPVSQVAYHLGFDDPAYFSRFFARRTGVSPRGFRAREGLQTE